ncbi:MAG: hypothetical protein ACREQQ_18715 [Candidatus Binatia bacterium]
MKNLIWALSAATLVACSSPQKQAWRDSGESWREGGNQFLRALGKSVNPDETNRKEEWKEVGRDMGEAGKDTGRAVSKSIDPDADKKP